MIWKRTTLATDIPVTLAEAKAQVRAQHDSDDDLITRMIYAATRWAEEFMARTLITTTWTIYFDRWISDILLPEVPIQEVNSIKYYDTDEVLQTVTATDYLTDVISEPGRVKTASGFSWPSLGDTFLPVRIEYDAGYGDASTDVPQDMRHAILLRVGEYYAHREDVVAGTIFSELKAGSSADLIYPYRMDIVGGNP